MWVYRLLFKYLAYKGCGLWKRLCIEPMGSPGYTPKKHVQSGNFGIVTDIAIGPNGIPIIATCSLDKTIRVYGLVDSCNQNWSEISRPFIHGHNFNAISWLNEFNLVTAASEKPLRLHEPSKILNKFNILKSYPDNLEQLSSCGLLQALNLTQIPNFDENKTNTIFGEIFKLPAEGDLKPGCNDLYIKRYAHGNSVINLVSNHSCTLLASSSESIGEKTPRWIHCIMGYLYY
ncbi:hypothetical protein MXB_3693 [Myxobolus squamalis]|nr:hypothetical protein MXB_3693 [Myxobolus squamalis]